MRLDQVISVVSLPALLRMKAEAGRPQDLIDIAELKRIEEIRHEI